MSEPWVKCDRHAEMKGEIARLRALLGRAEKALEAASDLIDQYSCDLERDSVDEESVPDEVIEAEQRWLDARADLREELGDE